MGASFNIQLDRAYEVEVRQKVLAVTRRLAFEALARVIQKSPVREGRFRGNWQLAIGVRPDGVVEAIDPIGGAPQAKGMQTIAELQPFQVVYLVNNLPYAEALENGHSQQAPAGVVAVTVAELSAFFSQAPS
jgi:hypothetical protein